MYENRLNTTALFFIIFLIAAPIISYWPGLSGGFLLDDYDNLKSLGNSGGIHNLDDLRAFVFNGYSGPLGRPVSLLSFTLDSQSWPAAPAPFKYSNILLHALNGIILFALIFKVLRLFGKQDNHALLIAFMAATIWLLHPLQISTVLYVIQRMTELSALFTFIGLWCYIHGRQQLAFNPGPAYLWMSTGVIFFGGLAILSKENGVLLPLYILIFEYTLLRHLPRPQHWRYWAAPMLGLPLLFIASYFLLVAINQGDYYAERNFTLFERLISQPRVLLDYISYILFPANTPTLFHDDFIISKSLFELKTIFSLIVIILLVLIAIFYRKKFPIISFSILWFLGAHVLESTLLPLELYFEHRNYLPLLGPALALGYYADRLLWTRTYVMIPCFVIFFFTLGAITWNYSETWGDKRVLTNKWAEEYPKSTRNKIMQSVLLLIDDDLIQSQNILTNIHAEHPEFLGAHIDLVSIKCIRNQLRKEDFDQLIESAYENKIDTETMSAISRLSGHIKHKACGQITMKGLNDILDGLIKRSGGKKPDGRIASLYMMKADIYLQTGQNQRAFIFMNEALRYFPNIDLALNQAYQLANAGQLPAANIQLSKAMLINKLRSPLIPSRENSINRVGANIEARARTLKN